MAHAAPGHFSRQLESLLEDGSAAGLSDRQLLERFTSRDEPTDQAAFAAMVARHGPMVLAVCRQLLGDHHHAEDAFQAVFLVLARQARSIRDPDLLGTWLYGVTVRTARMARGRIVRRREIEDDAAIRPLLSVPVPAVEQAMIEREQAEALHREIERLPGAFRMPVVLCYFEGLTLDEVLHRPGLVCGQYLAAAGWPGHSEKPVAAALRVGGFAACRPRWRRRRRHDLRERRSHPSVVTAPPGPRSSRRPAMPTRQRSRGACHGAGAAGDPCHGRDEAHRRR